MKDQRERRRLSLISSLFLYPPTHPPITQRCDGLAACENCVRRGYACHYSQRRRTGPKIRTAADEHPEWRAAATPNGLVPWLSNTSGSAATSTPTGAGSDGGLGVSSNTLGTGKSHSSNNSLSSNGSGGGGGGSIVGHVLQQAQFPPPPPHFAYEQEMGGGGGGGGGGVNAFPSLQISPASMLPTSSTSQLLLQQQQAASVDRGGGAPMPPLADNLYAQLQQQQGTSNIPLIGATEEKFFGVFLAELNDYLPIADKDMIRARLAHIRANGNRALPPSTLIPLLASLPPHTAASVQEVQLENAHNAIVWAAIAIGAMLVQETGNVERYTSLAWLSMKECFDFPSPATVSAYMLMAFVYMMFGELDRYRRYLSMAEGIASALGATLSNEVEVTLLYLWVGQNPDGKLLKADAYSPLSTSPFYFPFVVTHTKARI